AVSRARRSMSRMLHGSDSRVEMSAQRLISNRTSQQPASNSDYTWEYEYYEIGPVSFEGLKAHKWRRQCPLRGTQEESPCWIV
ncbi:Melanocortin-2 receptor accessory protein 2, partial [Manis javanica]